MTGYIANASLTEEYVGSLLFIITPHYGTRDSGEASQVDGFCAVAGVQLLEDILDMFVDGRLGNGEFLGDFAVLAPFAHEVQDFVFATSQWTPLSSGIQ